MYKIELNKLKDGCEVALQNTITDLNLQLYSLMIKRKLSIWKAEMLLNIENHILNDLFDYGLFKHSIKSFSLKQSGIIRLLYKNINFSYEDWEDMLNNLSVNKDVEFNITLCNDRLYHILNEKIFSFSLNELGRVLEIDLIHLRALKEYKTLLNDFSLTQEMMIDELFKISMARFF